MLFLCLYRQLFHSCHANVRNQKTNVDKIFDNKSCVNDKSHAITRKQTQWSYVFLFYPVTGQLLVGQLKDVLWNCEEELELDALL